MQSKRWLPEEPERIKQRIARLIAAVNIVAITVTQPLRPVQECNCFALF